LKFHAIIRWDPEVKVYWAEVIELPGCYTQGDTIEEVKKNLHEAIALYLEEEEVKIEEIIDLVEIEILAEKKVKDLKAVR